MSWVDKYTLQLKITTGDGKDWDVFTEPKYSKDVEYNGKELQFVDLDGQLIRKKNLKGRSFPLEFYFINEFHLDDSGLFEVSCLNQAPWIVQHPYYGTLLVQVLALRFDNTDLNYTKITCTARETIQDNGLTVSSNPVEAIKIKKTGLDALTSADPVINPKLVDIKQLQQTTAKNYKEGIKIITLPDDAQGYFNAFNTAQSSINSITASPILAMEALGNIIALPGQFESNVQDRIRTLVTQFGNLRLTLNGLLSLASKQLYQAQGVNLLSTMCVASVTPLDGNYTNASVALNISQIIRSSYNQFLIDIDQIQDLNGGNPLSFIPTFNTMLNLGELINLTVSNLFSIALAGRKEMSYVLKEDSNVVLLAYRFYKLDLLDNNLVEFITNNNLRYEQIALGLPKNTTVVYYV